MKQEIRDIIQAYLKSANRSGLNNVDFKLSSDELEDLMSGIIKDIEEILPNGENVKEDST